MEPVIADLPGTSSFTLFGSSHFAAVAVVAVVIAAATSWGRTRPVHRAALGARVIGLSLVATWVLATAVRVLGFGFPWREALPFHLCDALAFLGAWALWTRNRTALDILYLWTLGGTLHALVTPTPDAGYPDPRFFNYFAVHGSLVLAAAYTALGLRHRPGLGAPLRALVAMNALMAVAATVNAALGTNFMYLRALPPGPTLADSFGPWPWYIVTTEVVALASFFAWLTPFGVAALVARARGAAPATREGR